MLKAVNSGGQRSKGREGAQASTRLLWGLGQRRTRAGRCALHGGWLQQGALLPQVKDGCLVGSPGA